jgi:hypothetical protein
MPEQDVILLVRHFLMNAVNDFLVQAVEYSGNFTACYSRKRLYVALTPTVGKDTQTSLNQ